MSRSKKRSKKESERKPSTAPPGDFLTFPDCSGFYPVDVPVSPDAMIELSESLLASINSRPGAEEERLLTKVCVPFKL